MDNFKFAFIVTVGLAIIQFALYITILVLVVYFLLKACGLV